MGSNYFNSTAITGIQSVYFKNLNIYKNPETNTTPYLRLHDYGSNQYITFTYSGIAGQLSTTAVGYNQGATNLTIGSGNTVYFCPPNPAEPGITYINSDGSCFQNGYRVLTTSEYSSNWIGLNNLTALTTNYHILAASETGDAKKTIGLYSLYISSNGSLIWKDHAIFRSISLVLPNISHLLSIVSNYISSHAGTYAAAYWKFNASANYNGSEARNYWYFSTYSNLAPGQTVNFTSQVISFSKPGLLTVIGSRNGDQNAGIIICRDYSARICLWWECYI